PDPSDPVEDDSKLSVVEMVAFLEQRVITRSPHAKLRSSTSIMLSRAQPPSSASLLADPQPVPPSDRPISLQQGEEPDSVSVSDMVAKLESQCLRRRTQSEQRTVGRVLLAEQNHAQLANTQPISISKPLKATLTDSSTTETRKTSVSFCKTDVKVKVTCFSTDTKEVIKTVTKNTPTMPERSDAIGRGRTQSPPSCQSKPAQLSSQVKLNTTQKCESKETQKSPASTADILRPPGRVSEDFLLMRRRVQSLLEPRSSLSYLSLLPHHLLLQILLHLPTRALAALKCTCHYLRLVIDTYDPRPLDALWVCDPRYRDDPCKQCKRRHQRGDVSLCRWHHKPFCQAMPYGPGYWMCCHGDRRDAPGCNVGLHDNRWVPAFHSINAPIYRQRPREED
ncbi:hypothetical protein NQD34_016611, partial [Periophthalmus magnuspinnatus]